MHKNNKILRHKARVILKVLCILNNVDDSKDTSVLFRKSVNTNHIKK